MKHQFGLIILQSTYTVTRKGTRHVSQKATSNEKKRITVVLACTSRGEKFVVLKNPLPRTVQPPKGMNVYHNAQYSLVES